MSEELHFSLIVFTKQTLPGPVDLVPPAELRFDKWRSGS